MVSNIDSGLVEFQGHILDLYSPFRFDKRIPLSMILFFFLSGGGGGGGVRQDLVFTFRT